jgi:O-antigen/teichoic acid export membrane protein
MASLSKYTKETSWALAAKGSAFVFYYGLVFYLTQRMGVDTWGNWSAFLAVLNIILLASDQGINAASKRYIAQARGAAELGGVIRATFTLRLLASFIYALLITFLIQPLFVWLHQPEYAGLMQRSLLLVALYGLTEYFKSLFEALHRLRFTFVINTLEHGLKLGLVILLFRGGADFVSIVTAFTIAIAIALLAGLLLAIQTVPRISTSAVPTGLIRETYFYSLPIFLMSIGSLVALEIDTIMLKHLRTAHETGLYSAAKNIVMFLPHISMAISMGIIPGLSVFDASTALINRRIYYQILSALAGLYVLISLGIAAFALFGMHLFFKPEYYAASIPLLILTPFVVLSGISIYCGNLLDYRGLAWTRSTNFGLTIILNILLNLWWIPRWGAVGAAAASSIAWLPYCLFNLWQAHIAFALPGSNRNSF